MNWEVHVKLRSGASKTVHIEDYDTPTDATRAALAQTGGVECLYCGPLGNVNDNRSSDIDLIRSEFNQDLDRMRELVREEARYNEEMRRYEKGIQECDNGISSVVAECAHSLIAFWGEENTIAHEEGRRPLSFAEARLIHGELSQDGNSSQFPPMAYRPRVNGRVEVECIHCNKIIRIPSEKSGFITCPNCREDFYTDTTCPCSDEEIEEFWENEEAMAELDRKASLYG
jgi:hypothetical protein